MTRITNSDEMGIKDEKPTRVTIAVEKFLTAHAKVMSILIVAAIVVPVVAVVVQVSPVKRFLPAAKDFFMVETDGVTNRHLSDYLGKVVFLDLMATWCTACRQSMPDLQRIYDAYAGKPFVLLSVTTYYLSPYENDNVSLMKAFKEEFSANWTFAVPYDAPSVARNYGVDAYPTYAILDREGQIVYRSVGLVPLGTLNSYIDQALNS